MKNGLSNLGLKMNIMSNIKTLLSIFVLLIFSVSCEGGKMSQKAVSSIPQNNNIEENVLNKLSEKKIYFGHQSVGYNILSGVSDILKENPKVKLNIIRINEPSALNFPILAHSSIGQNENPESKIHDFERYMDKGVGNNPDIALFKFCYVDINRTTDIEKLFSAYKDTMGRLMAKYPNTRFVHITAPLTIPESSAKAFLKGLIGKEDNNIKRNLFNEKLRKEYGEKELIFDLAEIESTYPDGSRTFFTSGGKRYYTLAPEYTDDGGHLNEKGRKIVASDFLRFLSGLAKE